MGLIVSKKKSHFVQFLGTPLYWLDGVLSDLQLLNEAN